MKRAPWVLIAGGFHRYGGMDKANLALAEYLLDQKHEVHLVCHSVAPHLSRHPLVKVHLVRRPFPSFMLGDPALNARGRRIARRIKTQHPDARVLTNGGSCHWNDINWVHCVHKAWPCNDETAPYWFRVKNHVCKRLAIASERHAFFSSHIVIANSEKTRRELIALHNIDSKKVCTVYPGAEGEWTPPSDIERELSRSQLSIGDKFPIVLFAGALGLDNNKGFDTLWAAWQSLCQDVSWDSHLIVAGAGNGVSKWRKQVSASGLSSRVSFLGFSSNVPDLLAASDLLVSPVRYEAYGLNVQEAVCRGVPAIVSNSAGIAERFPSNVQTMLLHNPDDVPELIARLKAWRSNMWMWKDRFKTFGESVRTYGWQDMARRITEIAKEYRQRDESTGDCI